MLKGCLLVYVDKFKKLVDKFKKLVDKFKKLGDKFKTFIDKSTLSLDKNKSISFVKAVIYLYRFAQGLSPI